MAIKTRRFYSARKSCSCSMPGVWRAVAYMNGAVVVFHSPRACAHVARTMDINSQYRTLSEGVRLGGIIGNGRNTPNEQQLLQEFAKRLHTQLIAFIPRDVIVNKAENNRQTVLQYAPESAQAGVYRKLAHDIWHNENMAIPTPMSFEELEKLVAEYGN